jgi:hypothetical protein
MILLPRETHSGVGSDWDRVQFHGLIDANLAPDDCTR